MGGNPKNSVRRAGAHWYLLFTCLVSVLPLLYLAAFVRHYALDLPILDQWNLVPLLRKSYENELTVWELLGQHNEHRPFFPKLIMLALARASHWNIHLELVTNFVLGVGIFLFIALQVTLTSRETRSVGVLGSIPCLAVLLFSTVQWENWLWGWQIQEFLSVLMSIGALQLLSSREAGPVRVGAAIAAGIIASYSFANGLLVWPVGFVGLLLMGRANLSAYAGRLAVWLGAGAATTTTYLIDFSSPQENPTFAFVLERPIEYGAFVCAYLGSPIAGIYGSVAAAAVGVCGMLFVLAATWYLLRSGAVRVETLVPYLMFAVYGLGSAALTGVGRSSFGMEQALTSRYSTLANPFWVSCVVLLFLVAFTPLADPARARRSRRIRQGSVGCALALFVGLILWSEVHANRHVREVHAFRITLQEKLLRGDRDPMMQYLYPDVDWLMWWRDVARKYAIGPYRGDEPE